MERKRFFWKQFLRVCMCVFVCIGTERADWKPLGGVGCGNLELLLSSAFCPEVLNFSTVLLVP